MSGRSMFLSPPDFWRIEFACQLIRKAFGTAPYLVGSVLLRPDFRDIDIRLILPDDHVDRMFGERPGARLLVNIALSDLLTRISAAPAPVDFQIQSMTEANVPEHGTRNPIGVRSFADFAPG